MISFLRPPEEADKRGGGTSSRGSFYWCIVVIITLTRTVRKIYKLMFSSVWVFFSIWMKTGRTSEPSVIALVRKWLLSHRWLPHPC